MIIPSLDKKLKNRIKRPCLRCGKMFIRKGLSHSEKLCEKCFDKARSRK